MGRRGDRAARWAAKQARQTSVFDMYGGATGRMREAQRDAEALRQADQIAAATSHMAGVLDALLAEQRETNRLLRLLVEQRQPG